jgi:hypothetical protein
MDWSRTGMLVWVAGFFLVSSAHAAPRVDTLLKKAKASYDDYEFDKAAAYYEDALRAGVTDQAKREQTLLYYAFSLFGLERAADAKAQLRELFKLNGNYALDRKGLHPSLLRFYDDEKAAAQQAAVKAAPPPASDPPKNVEQQTTITVAPTELPPPEVTTKVAPPYVSAHPVLKLLPFGIGQFANGDPAGGAAFLAVELALVGANVAFAVLDENARSAFAKQTGAATPQQQAENNLFYAMRTASGVAAILVGAFGILDAFLWSPGRAEARHKLRYSFMLAPTQTGAAIAGSVRF